MRAAMVASALLVLAGCVQPEAPVAPAATEPEILIDEDRPDTTLQEVETGPAAAPDTEATLDAPPKLIPGEWWRIRFSTGFADEVPDMVRVVGAVFPEGYVFGMPHEGWFKEAIAYHAPAFGDVGLDLSYNVHNVRFEPVRFPLTVGATWDTEFATAEYVAKVESVDGKRATVVLQPKAASDPAAPFYELVGLSNTPITVVYDAEQHEVVYFESPIGTWEVVEHGYDYQGWITVPRGEHTAIDYGQLGPVTPGDSVVMRTKEVAGGFNRLTMMHAIFQLAPGAYRIRSVTPNGTEFVTEAVAQTALTLRFYEASDPDGTWQLEDVVAGAAATYSMGIAYHQYDIRLPDGLRRSDHSHSVIR